MLSDPIADMLTSIRNAVLAKKQSIFVPYSKLKEELGKILAKESYLKNIKVKKFRPKDSQPRAEKMKNKERKFLICQLNYEGEKSVITKIRRISKPSLRVYVKKDKIPKVLAGMGTNIISTTEGLMTGKEARKKNLGGELICEIW